MVSDHRPVAVFRSWRLAHLHPSPSSPAPDPAPTWRPSVCSLYLGVGCSAAHTAEMRTRPKVPSVGGWVRKRQCVRTTDCSSAMKNGILPRMDVESMRRVERGGERQVPCDLACTWGHRGGFLACPGPPWRSVLPRTWMASLWNPVPSPWGLCQGSELGRCTRPPRGTGFGPKPGRPAGQGSLDLVRLLL